MTEWEQIKLSDVCDLVAGFAFKSKDFGNYENKVIKIANIIPPYVDMEHLSGIDISKYDSSKLKNYLAQKGDYVLAMTGATIGKLGIILDSFAYINQRVLLFKPNDKIHKQFLYYILFLPKFNKYILNFVDSDTAQPNISANTIGKYEFVLPTLDLQKKIAAVLGALDDKIELNNKINHNLEQQAQALFKSWFVDFEPFGGIMPDDWKVGKLEDIVEFSNGYAFKSSELLNSPDGDCFDVFKQGHINRGGGFNPTGTKSWYPKDKAQNLKNIF
jgi:type I restriction enzyme S subunit